MRATLRDDLKAAIKGRDKVAVAALRSALAAIENAEALPPSAPDPAADQSEHVAGAKTGLYAAEADRRTLTDADVRSILEREVSDRTTSAAEYDRLGRPDLATTLRAEAAVLTHHLT